MNDILITVITPVFNTRAKYLKKYFSSLCFHDNSVVEVILVDDGSDRLETKHLLREYADKYHRIVNLITLKKNHGVSFCRNIALKLAKGEYIIFADSDDWYDFGYFDKMCSVAKATKADMIIGGYRLCNDDENVISEYLPQRDYFFQIRSTICSRLIRRSKIVNNNIFYPEECYIEDLPFNMFLASACNTVKFLDNAYYNIRIRQESLSHSTSIYTRLTVHNAPLSYIEEHLKKMEIETIDDSKLKEIYAYTIFILSAISCFWCRNSERDEIRKLSKYSAQIIKENIPSYFGGYIKYIIKNGISRDNLIGAIFSLVVLLRCEGICSYFAGKICRKVYDEAK